MAKWRETQELIELDGRIKVPYLWSAGEVGTRYLTALSEEKKFFGTRCPNCKIVYHVPRRNCPDCFEECGEWVELGPVGVVEAFTVVRRHHPQLAPLPLPFGFGVIKLEGADTGFLHLISEFEDDQLTSGMTVEPVFDDEAEPGIMAVAYFRPYKGVE